MIFCDLIHGYQPFNKEKICSWAKDNLKNIFLPTSLAMKQGLVYRGAQLQGWTIDLWLNSSSDIACLAKKTLQNLKKANKKKYIEIGASAYAHSILPMLSKDLIIAEIVLDMDVVEKYLGKPTWFWFPEGAVDQRVLKIVHEVFPDLILLLPDKIFKQNNFNGPINIKFLGKKQKALVFNTLFKDLFMNAEDYRKKPKYLKRPGHLPAELVWTKTRRVAHSFKSFNLILNYLKKVYQSNTMVLMRDWENAGSKKGLRRIGLAKEIGNFLKLKNQAQFYLPSQFDWSNASDISLNKILPCSWDIASNKKDPFPWWQPNPDARVWRGRTELKRKKLLEWQSLIKDFDTQFQKIVKKQGGIHNLLKNKKAKKILKQCLPALHSCVGWHYFARRSWNNYRHAKKAFENISKPALDKLNML